MFQFPFDLTFIFKCLLDLETIWFFFSKFGSCFVIHVCGERKLFGSQRKLTTFDKDVKIQVKYVHIWGTINFLMLRFAFLSSYL